MRQLLQQSVTFLLFLLLTLSLSACFKTEEPGFDETLFLDETEDVERERNIWAKPRAVLEAMGDIEEKVIADIGAGKGFFSFRLAPFADRVIAIEVEPEKVEVLKELREVELPTEYHVRLEPRLAEYDDPKLERSEVDIILMSNTFYQINSVDYLKRLYPALRPDGRIVIVDWKKRNGGIGPPKQDRISLGDVEDMLLQAGFHVASADDATLEYQYIIVADKLRE